MKSTVSQSSHPTKLTTSGGERQYEAWETLAPLLCEVQRDSVRDIQKHCMELPLPASLLVELNQFNTNNNTTVMTGEKSPDLLNSGGTVQPRTVTPSQLGLINNSNNNLGGPSNNLLRGSTSPNYLFPGVGNSSSSRNSPRLLVNNNNNKEVEGSKFVPAQPIVTTSNFLLWFSNIEPELIIGKEDVYRRYQHTLLGYETKCTELLQDLTTVKDILHKLLLNQREVTEKTSNIREACYDILKSQSNLERNLELIEKQLRPFDQLSHIYHFLSRPGNDICLHPLFSSTLQQMDTGIEFLKSHTNYKDAGIYLSRYQQCMTRALSMIHIYLSDRIVELKTEFLKPKEAVPLAAELADGYQQFRYLASEVRSLIVHLEQRAAQNPDHVNLLIDCYEILLRNRGILLKKLLPNIASTDELFNALVDGTAHMHSILRDEESLFRSFFSIITNNENNNTNNNNGETELRTYLDDLLSNFYELWGDRLTKWIKSTYTTSPNYTSTLSDSNQYLNSQKITLENNPHFKKSHQTVHNILTLVTSKLP